MVIFDDGFITAITILIWVKHHETIYGLKLSVNSFTILWLPIAFG
tara:strand:+ start:2640 stop:2774 length:135 start_codon:yes stop_codon:yes gene_type:complete